MAGTVKIKRGEGRTLVIEDEDREYEVKGEGKDFLVVRRDKTEAAPGAPPGAGEDDDKAFWGD